MNVDHAALLLPCLLTGGTEVASLETALALKAHGYAVDVIVYFKEIDPIMLETFNDAGVVVRLLGVRRGGGLRAQLQLAVKLLCSLRHDRFNVIWMQYTTPTLLPLLVSRLLTRNLIACVHVAASHYSSSGLSRMRWIARHWCARFVCVSHTVANGIFGSEGGAERIRSRVRVLPNALDLRAVQNAEMLNWQSQAGWPADVVVLGFAGRLTHLKGVDVLLRSVALLHGEGMPVRLVVVGDGDEAINLQLLGQQLGISAITFFAGRMPRADIYGAIKGFDIAVMPSRVGLEGFGLSALEAMAAGVPVVASKVDALQEVVVDGSTGLLCPGDDAEALAASLSRLLSDPSLRNVMGVAGAAHVARYYDTPAYRAGLAELLSGLGLPVMDHI